MTVTVTAAVEATAENAYTTALLGEAYSYVIPLAERIATDTYPIISYLLGV